MTVSTTANSATWTGNGATATFSYGFYIPSTASYTVVQTDTSGNQTKLGASAYTITGVGSVGGTVTLNGGNLPTGYLLTLIRSVPYTQLTSLSNQGGLWPSVVEQAIDNVVLQVQQLAQQYGTAITFNPADTTLPSPLPVASLRAGNVLAFDAYGQVTVVSLSAALSSGTTFPAAVSTALAQAPTGTGALALANAPTLVNPVVGTQSSSDNSTRAASTAYVQAALTAFLAAYPQTTVSTKSAAYTITTSDNNSLIVAGAYPMTLPSAPAGAFRVTILSSATGTTILPNGNTVNLASGATSSTILLPAAGDFVTLVWDGTVWRELGGSAAMIAIVLAKSTVSGGAFNTTYTNSTGHTIFVSATVSLLANATVTLNIAGVSWAWAGQGAGASVGFTCQVSGPVGPGETYSFASVGSATLQYITVAK